MIAVHRVYAENFRSLAEVDVRLGDLNVLVGPNAAGKSNFLELFGFLGDVARLDLGPAIAAHGGWQDLRFRGESKTPGWVRIDVEAQITQNASSRAPDEYSLSFHQGEVLARKETFVFKRTPGRGRRITVAGTRYEFVVGNGEKPTKRSLSEGSAGLATLQRLGEEEGAKQVRELASLFETLRVLDVDVPQARRPAPLVLSPKLEADASNLANFLVWLASHSPDVFALLQEDLAAIVPGIQEIVFQWVGGSTEAVRVRLKEQGLGGETDLAYASFGTIRALALLAMLHDPHPPRLTCVEEIDHGLHPYALDRIVERLRSAAKRTQLLLATHSPALVNRLRPEELIVCERDRATGASRIPAVDPDDVRRMVDLGDLQLGELWFSGSLGGVP